MNYERIDLSPTGMTLPVDDHDKSVVVCRNAYASVDNILNQLMTHVPLYDEARERSMYIGRTALASFTDSSLGPT